MAHINDAMVSTFLKKWYEYMDNHAPVEKVVKAIDPVLFKMQIIDSPFIVGESGFRDWYNEKITTSFDSVHTVHSVDYEICEDEVSVTILADWSGRNWVVPQVKSEAVTYHDKLICRLRYDEEKNDLVFVEYLVREAS